MLAVFEAASDNKLVIGYAVRSRTTATTHRKLSITQQFNWSLALSHKFILMILERAKGIEPRFKSSETCADGRPTQVSNSAVRETRPERAGNQSKEDEAKFLKVNRSESS
jgi:hypothetical protein